MTTIVRHALVEHDGLSGAIMDHALSDGDSTARCARLKVRGILANAEAAVRRPVLRRRGGSQLSDGQHTQEG